jgi:Icc protein
MIRILQLTDLHVFAEPRLTLKGIPTRESLQEVVDWIVDREDPFDHVIITGDYTHDERSESYQAVREQLERIDGQRWQVPGNHDDRSVLRTVFPEVNQQIQLGAASAEGSIAADSPIRFSFVAGDWHCLGLDTHLPGEVPGLFDEEQQQWLTQQLQQSAAARIALFCHHPPIDVGSVWMDKIGLQRAEHLQALVFDDDRIRFIFCGHVHHDFSGTLHHAAVHATPSTGIQFDPAGDVPHFAPDAPGCRVIQLDGTELTHRIVRLPSVRYVPTED